MKGFKTSILLAFVVINSIHNITIDNSQLPITDTGVTKKSKTLHLFDIDDVVSDIAARKDLKLASTMFNKNSLTYNMKGFKDRKLTLKINKSKNNYDLHLDDDASHAPITLNIPNKAYYTSEIKNFLNSNIVKVAKTVPRKLIEIGELKDQLKNIIDQNKFTVSDDGNNGITIQTKDDNKTTAKIKLELNNEKLTIIMSNRENQTGGGYNNPHSIYRGIIPKLPEDKEKVKEQLTMIFESGKDKVLTKKENSSIATLFTNKGNDNNTKITCNEKNQKLILCQFGENNNPQALNFYIKILDNGKYRVTLSKANQTFDNEFEYPDDQVITNIISKLKEINDSISKQNELKIGDIMKESLTSASKCAINNSFPPNDYGYFKINVEGCAINESMISYTRDNFGFYNYLHLKLDNTVVRYEYNINIDSVSFNDTLKESVKKFVDVTNSLKNITDNEGKIVTVTSKDIIEKIKNLISGNDGSSGVTCDEQKLQCTAKIHGKEIPVITVKTTKDKSIAITMISPISNKENNKSSHPTIIIKETNGYDQFEHIKTEITDFLKGVGTTGNLRIIRKRLA